jgi:hypothetical protein
LPRTAICDDRRAAYYRIAGNSSIVAHLAKWKRLSIVVVNLNRLMQRRPALTDRTGIERSTRALGLAAVWRIGGG